MEGDDLEASNLKTETETANQEESTKAENPIAEDDTKELLPATDTPTPDFNAQEERKSGTESRPYSAASSLGNESSFDYVPLQPSQSNINHVNRHQKWIVLSSFVLHVIVAGFLQSFGVWYLAYKDYFKDANWKTTIVGSITNGTSLFVGPIASALCIRFGHRPVCMAGGALVTASLILSTLAPSIDVLIISCGIFAGTGLGLMYLPSIVIIGLYFDERRALATGLAICGSGIGSAAFAPLISYMIETHNWQNAMIVIACIMLIGVPMGALLAPPGSRYHKHKVPKWKQYLSKCCVNKQTVQDEQQQQQQQRDGSTASTPITTPDMMARRQTRRRFTIRYRKVSLQEKALIHSCPNLVEDIPTMEELDASIIGSSLDVASLFISDKRLSKTVNHIQERASQIMEKVVLRRQTHALHVQQQNLQRLSTLEEGGESNVDLPNVNSENIDTRPSTPMNNVLPFSTMIFPPHGEKGKKTDQESLDEKRQKKGTKKKDHLCERILGVSVLKNLKFSLFGLSTFIYTLGLSIPTYYITSYAKDIGIDNTGSSFLLSIFGITNTIGRVGAGWFADRSWVNDVTVNICTLILAGIITVLLPFYNSYGLLAAYIGVYGFCAATFSAYQPLIVIELVGINKLTKAFGILGMLRGISSFVGPPIAGALYDVTLTLSTPFIVAGSTMFVAAVVMMPIRYHMRVINEEEIQDKIFKEKLDMISQMSLTTTSVKSRQNVGT